MRYVIVDLDGAPRGHFASRAEARAALGEIEDEHAGAIADLYVLVYEGGTVVPWASTRADEFVAAHVAVHVVYRGERVDFAASATAQSQMGCGWRPRKLVLQ